MKISENMRIPTIGIFRLHIEILEIVMKEVESGSCDGFPVPALQNDFIQL